MTKLYKATVNDTWMHSTGIGWWTQFGDAREVDGVSMVQVSYGALFPSDGWHETEREAVLAAAAKVESIGRRLLEQADQMRAKTQETPQAQ